MFKRISVWHVDGCPEVLDATGELLRDNYYDVTSEISGLRAYGWIHEGINPNVAIIDYHVHPEGFEYKGHLITGLDLIILMKERNNGQTFVLSTSTSGSRHPGDNSDKYLAKPIRPATLLETLRMATASIREKLE